MKKLIIAVDGFASCGKSTMAKELAEKLQYIYIDSGAMYRAVTLFCLRNSLISKNIVDVSQLLDVLDELRVEFRYVPEMDKNGTFLNGENVEVAIRSSEVSSLVSEVSKIKEVRETMVKLQREMGKNGGIVMDGRDIGTVVFPNADVKIFVTASLEVRATRRYKEQILKEPNITLKEIKANLNHRDFLDQNRSESPLRQAADAIVLDNSEMTPSEQMSWLLEKINEKIVKI